jgi:hypothetical protein
MKAFDVYLKHQKSQCAAACREFVSNNQEDEILQVLKDWLTRMLATQKGNDAPGLLLHQMAILGLMQSIESVKESGSEPAND